MKGHWGHNTKRWHAKCRNVSIGVRTLHGYGSFLRGCSFLSWVRRSQRLTLLFSVAVVLAEHAVLISLSLSRSSMWNKLNGLCLFYWPFELHILGRAWYLPLSSIRLCSDLQTSSYWFQWELYQVSKDRFDIVSNTISFSNAELLLLYQYQRVACKICYSE